LALRAEPRRAAGGPQPPDAVEHAQIPVEILERVPDPTLANKERFESLRERTQRDGAAQDLPQVTYEDVERFHDSGAYAIEIRNGLHVAALFLSDS
jgi:hypothetical protein